MLPHIVFSDAPGYYPGPQVWRTDLAATAPRRPDGSTLPTSGICQPPVHGIAVARILDIAREPGADSDDAAAASTFARGCLPRLVAWHEWLLSARDPQGGGTVEIHHGWESGMDNSPRWDSAYAAVVVDPQLRLARQDLAHVADATDRPSDAEYGRYLQLVGELRAVGYDDTAALDVVQFRVKDVLLTAVLAAAADETARVADLLAEPEVAARQREIAAAARAGVLASVDAAGRCRDYDVRAQQWIETETVASWSLLLCGAGPHCSAGDTAAERVWQGQLDQLRGSRWSGHPGLRHQVPPTVSPDDAGFRPRTYWRGPTWPVLTWLFSWALRDREPELAGHWRRECLSLLSDGSFSEYYDPLTGEPAGSRDQSWTAAAVLDWAAREWTVRE